MSHQPERKEKDCLNCGAQVEGRFCHKCGQENIVPHQGFWSLTRHFIYDIFHFDGKFFDTLKYLFTRPGRVPLEYIQGRRTAYLDPIRMYLFTSAVFFLIFFSIQRISEVFTESGTRYMTKIERYNETARLYPVQKQRPADTLLQAKMALLLDTTKSLRLSQVKGAVPDTLPTFGDGKMVYVIRPERISRDTPRVSSESGWMARTMGEKWRRYKAQYNDDTNRMFGDFTEKFVHWFPYILFVSLPLFAWLLKLLYIRRKRFYYSDHAVFTLYHYIFTFILLLLLFGFGALEDRTGWTVFNTLNTLLLLLWPVYLLLSMKRFYSQGWGRTIVKFILLNFLGQFMLFTIFTLFIVLFILQL